MLSALIISIKALAQVNYTKNATFELAVDSIERRINQTRRDTDTTYYIHYTVKNISGNALAYVTNSCFYYNHCTLTVGETTFDVNPQGGCYANTITYHYLKAGESFKHTEWATASNFNTLVGGVFNTSLVITLVVDNDTTYRVDGNGYAKNIEQLIFNKPAKVVETYGRKKGKKTKAKLV
ncbi:MAG: hypothetical protein M0D57_16250 [Sphingobacteriales bacterium JAD_PAG50586_3]|nr:MAG: hypothetical protein M0D57_16250 [Sphingobacteriales bacterium JAD_PAG50586_3]